jgi:hypothetical protein
MYTDKREKNKYHREAKSISLMHWYMQIICTFRKLILQGNKAIEMSCLQDI